MRVLGSVFAAFFGIFFVSVYGFTFAALVDFDLVGDLELGNVLAALGALDGLEGFGFHCFSLLSFGFGAWGWVGLVVGVGDRNKGNCRR